MDVAEKHNLVVIEDCTHGFGGFYKGRKNGTIADAAFFSSQWNKPFSTGIGGMAVVKDEVWSAKMNDFEKSCAKPSLKNIMMLRLLWLIRRYLLFPFFYWNAVKLFRWLSKRNIVTGSSEGIELSQPVMPEQYLKQLSGFQAKLGAKSIQRIDKNIRHRIQVAKHDEVLKRLHKTTPEVPEGIVHTFVKYPLLVKDRKSFIAAAEKSSIEIGDWFISPLHPIEEELSKWAFDEKQFPVATDKAKHIVNLPTHQDIDTKYLTRITEFLKAHQEEIL